MIVTVRRGADPDTVQKSLLERGLWVCRHDDPLGRVQFVSQPWSGHVDAEAIRALDGVEAVAEPPSPHPLVDALGPRAVVAGVPFGAGAEPVLVAGPCSVESPAQIEALAARLAPLGVRFLRGGAFKPRTSPYSFQGHGEAALDWLRRAATAHGLGVVTEATSEAAVPAVAERADIVQVGSRNMHTAPLLQAVGRAGKPVLLKRGMAATVEEWLLAAEYLLVAGAPAVIFCERGVRGFDASTRNLLDLGAVALLAHVHRVPVLVDPSHAVGRRDLVIPLSLAAVAAGAAGVVVETHDDPGAALSDGPQALTAAQLADLALGLARGTRAGDPRR
ncbi:MAG: 3-deoxy-7-phosphoheptulonate synthase [Acidobacteria bacterium]|nr:3-deoxy-7-phosphoheptulonate synthase [Acidobacteriota bacterium]